MSARAQALTGLAHAHLDEAGHRTAKAPFSNEIRLTAARLPQVSPEHYVTAPGPARATTAHLAAALKAMDSIPPLEGPADLQLCAWHVHELLRIATREQAS